MQLSSAVVTAFEDCVDGEARGLGAEQLACMWGSGSIDIKFARAEHIFDEPI